MATEIIDFAEIPSKRRKLDTSSNMASVPDQFEGFMIHDTKNWTKFTKEKVGDTF